MAFDLSTIQRGPVLAAPRIVLYGVRGIGKTTFAASMPSPIFIQTEEGSDTVDTARFPLCSSWADLLAQLETLGTTEHEFRTVVIDSLSAAEPLLWQHVCAKHGADSIQDNTKGSAFGYGRGFDYAAQEAAATLLPCLDALRRRGMAVVLIGHAEVRRFDDPTGEPYDRYRVRVHDKLADRVLDWCDAQLFANYRTYRAKDEGAKRARGVGQGERVLYTSERPAHHAKNRYRLPYELPFSWDALQSAMQEGTKGDTDTNNNHDTEK